MNYLLNRNTRGARRNRVLFGVFGAAIFAVIGLMVLVPHFFPAIFITIAKPFWRADFSIESGSLDTPATLLAENESLRRDLADISTRISLISAIEQENADLQSLFGRATTTTRLAAAVISRPPRSSYDEIIIDVGTDEGVRIGDRVYAPGDVPIGTVTDVVSGVSKVSLFSSPGTSRDVFIGTAHIPAVARGQGGGQYAALVPNATSIPLGEMVVDADASAGRMPLGLVTRVISDPAQAFETVLFAPSVNIYELRWVWLNKHMPEKQKASAPAPVSPKKKS